jgi:gp16 family phage-associated protein
LHQQGDNDDCRTSQISSASAGVTFTRWAEENGYSRNEVYRVNGFTKARYEIHEIAVKLGLKPDSNAA